MRGPSSVLAVVILLASTSARGESARELVQLRGELEALREAIGAMLGQVGQRDTQLADLERRVAQLAAQASATEAVTRTGADVSLLAAHQELIAQVAQLRADVDQLASTPVASQVDHVDGFVWTTEDEAYQLRLGGYLQGRWTVQRGTERDDGFELHRTRLVLDGSGPIDLGFRIMTELVPDPVLVDAWLEFAKRRVAVRAGRDRVPFTRSLLVPENQLAFADTPVVTQALGWDRDTGGQIRLGMSHALITAWVGNGNPDDDVPLVAVREEMGFGGIDAGAGDRAISSDAAFVLGLSTVVDAMALPAMLGDVALVADRDGDGAPDRIGVLGWGGDLTFRRHGFELAAELVARWEMWGDYPMLDPALAAVLGSTQPRQTRVAGSLDLTQMLGERVMFGMRFAGGELPILSLRGDGVLPRARTAVELDTALGFYWKTKRIFTLTYRFLRYGQTLEGTDGGRDHAVIGEAQLEL